MNETNYLSLRFSDSVSFRMRRSDAPSFSKRESKEMRQYYLSILENDQLSFSGKRLKLQNEIVLPIQFKLGIPKNEPMQLPYVIGKKLNRNKITAKHIKTTETGVVFCMGRLRGNDLYFSKSIATIEVSRIQAFILVIGTEIVIIDVWSVFGTETLYRNHDNQNTTKTKNNKKKDESKKKLIASIPNERNILRFDRNETFHLNCKESNIEILFNPIVCAETTTEEIDSKEQDTMDNDMFDEMTSRQIKFRNWLFDSVELGEYFEKFMEKGFDDIDVIIALNDNDLKEIGVDKVGHRMRLLNEFKIVQNKDSKNERRATMNLQLNDLNTNGDDDDDDNKNDDNKIQNGEETHKFTEIQSQIEGDETETN